MTRPPSQAVIEAVEQAFRVHVVEGLGWKCTCGVNVCNFAGYERHSYTEVARAAEAAALRAAAERMDDLSRGTPLAAAITARAAAIRLDHWADELTDTDDGSKP